MSGTAFDVGAPDGTGIAQIQAFLGDRDQGGVFLGDAMFDPTSADAAWTLLANFPASAVGPGTLFVYGQSVSNGAEATLQVPISVEDSTPPTGTPDAICPSTPITTEPIAAAEMPMTNVEWQWTAVDDPSAYTITFLDSGLFQVHADCNASTGGYVIEGNSLTLLPGPTTLVECPPGSLFDQFLANLGQVSSFTIDADKLVLQLGEGGRELVFAPGDMTGAPGPLSHH